MGIFDREIYGFERRVDFFLKYGVGVIFCSLGRGVWSWFRGRGRSSVGVEMVVGGRRGILFIF